MSWTEEQKEQCAFIIAQSELVRVTAEKQLRGWYKTHTFLDFEAAIGKCSCNGCLGAAVIITDSQYLQFNLRSGGVVLRVSANTVNPRYGSPAQNDDLNNLRKAIVREQVQRNYMVGVRNGAPCALGQGA